jgi:hypothetical protein
VGDGSYWKAGPSFFPIFLSVSIDGSGRKLCARLRKMTELTVTLRPAQAWGSPTWEAVTASGKVVAIGHDHSKADSPSQ